MEWNPMNNPDDDEREAVLLEEEQAIIDAKLALESGNLALVEEKLGEAHVWIEKARA